MPEVSAQPADNGQRKPTHTPENMNAKLAVDLPSLADVVDAAPVGVLIVAADGKIKFVNAVLEKMFGYPSGQMVGTALETLLPEALRHQHQQLRDQFMQQQGSREMGAGLELKAQHADGHLFPVEIGIGILDGGEPRHAIAFVMDLSLRQRLEQRFRRLMESMPFGLLMTDERGQIVMTNPELESIFAYPSGSLIGQSVELLVPERLRAQHAGFREAFAHNPGTRKMGSGRELVARRSNGIEFPAEIALTPLLDDGRKMMLAAISDITLRKGLENTLRRQSLYDSLTQLPNRNLFFDRLEQACIGYSRHQIGFSVLMMDLNRFKEVNDNLGHHVGDVVLCEVGQRLAVVMRKSDTFARLGGDEFAVVLHGTNVAEDALQLAYKMIEAMRTPVLADGHALSIGISIGVALCPLHGQDQTTLLAHADQAMYQSKRSLKAVVVADNEQAPPHLLTQLVSNEIGLALQRQELVMHYQPKVDLRTGELIGVEALVRWQRPGIGMVGPIEFVPAIEESALLEPFTFATLDLVLQELRHLLDNGQGLPVAVNLSARMLEYDNLEDKVIERLQHYDIPPGYLTLEITETALVVNPLHARRAIDRLAQYGVKFSIDDFGAGFTSFKYLKTFRIAEIKMDKEFVSEITPGSFDATLISSIAAFCNGLNIRMVAEGIENATSGALLQTLGCYVGQGYFIARPMPMTQLLEWQQARGATACPAPPSVA